MKLLLTIPVRVYNTDVYVSLDAKLWTDEMIKGIVERDFDKGEKDVRKIKKRLKPMMESDMIKGYCFTYRHSHFVTVKNFNKKSAESYMSLNHELLHATINILHTAGLALTDESCEAFTYLYGYLTHEVYHYLV